MKRRQISDQVLTWLLDNLLPDDFGLPRQHLFVIRRPGAGKPLCLITAATGRYCWSEDGKRRARLEAAGYRVITVRSAREAEMAIGPKLLDELRQRRAEAERPRPVPRRVVELLVALADVDPVRYQPAAPVELARAA